MPMLNSNLHDVLKLGFWNIEGYNSKIIGNKLIHSDFLETFRDRDIIGLVETHIHNLVLDKLTIPGFSRIQFLSRGANSKGKGSGGIALFCKPSILKYATPLASNNEDVIWLKIDKKVCGVDIYLGTIYISPKGNKENKQKQLTCYMTIFLNFRRKGKLYFKGILMRERQLRKT